MQTDYLIIGQGISGTWLSYYLKKEGASFLVIDDKRINSSSRVAAGIINPVTGRRYVTVWLAEKLIENTREAYSELGNKLGITAYAEKILIDFFPSAQMRLSFLQRIEEKAPYLNAGDDDYAFSHHFHYELGFGIIRPVFTAHPEIILPAWRQHLNENNLLLEETFDTGQLILVADKVEYKNITARKIIFCDGVTGDQLPWFSSLPFAPNKGECLTLNIPGLPNDRLYKKGMMLCPLSEPDQWWIGSSYEWDFKEDLPTDFFHQKTVALLKEWLKLPFEITGHYASLRPATLERRPFAGLHPLYPSIGILNGMGTKGFSLAPYIARQFCAHLLRNEPLQPEADINRFRRILSGKIG